MTMTIDEAIAILTDFREQESKLLGNEFRDASALGIEALRLVKRYKELKVGFYRDLLPGETEK